MQNASLSHWHNDFDDDDDDNGNNDGNNDGDGDKYGNANDEIALRDDFDDAKELASSNLEKQQPWKQVNCDRDNDSKNGTVGSDVTAKPLWKDIVDKKSGRTYFYNRVTKVSQWVRPSDYEMDVLRP